MPPVEHLYIHIPFCPKLCPYCCFYVEEGSRNKNTAFVEAILAELDAHMERRPVVPRTIYLGGGTPTALLMDQLELLFTGLRKRLPLEHLEEWTIEANPATVRAEKARLIRDAGVTRISLGVQSWDDTTLKTLGRVHSSKQAHATFDVLRAVAFPALNVDLMFSVPGQSLAQWESDLDTTIRLNPDHVSAYCLTYEEDTEYFRKLTSGKFVQNEAHDASLFEGTMDRLGAAGYRQYEISNHARPGFESRHNLACWDGKEYLGLGPSAFSTLGGNRIQNICDTAGYVARIKAGASPEATSEKLDAATLLKERIAFGLRKDDGIPEELLENWQTEAAHLQEIGLLETRDGSVVLTRRGRMLADAVGETFM